jgi:hypothetical protein
MSGRRRQPGRGAGGARPSQPAAPPHGTVRSAPRGTPGQPTVIRVPAAQPDWVEIEVVDAEGHPAAGARWVLTAASGPARQGTVDGQGRARITGIPPGPCTVKITSAPGH